MKPHRRVVLLVLFCLTLWSLPMFAQTTAASEPKLDTGDTAWMLTSAALVLFMTIPGLFLFYGGLVRSKNVLGMLMQNFIMVGIITIQWIVIGYSLAFANGTSFLGGLQWADRKSTRLNSSHTVISYAVFCLKKKKKKINKNKNTKY